MNYLMDQAVMNFDDSGARGSAIGSAVSEGMVSYLQDTSAVEVYRAASTAIAGWDRIDSPQSSNLIINGGFDIWQRGTAGTYSSGIYSGADRWINGANSTVITRDSDVPANVSQYSLKIVNTSANSIFQRIESANISHLVGKPVTFSFYYKRTSGTGNLDVRFYYPSAIDNFGTVTEIGTPTVLSASPSSSWTRYQTTLVLPSEVSRGFQVLINNDGNTTSFITGVQLELGLGATPFRRNASSIQGELAACQRYYWRNTVNANNARICYGVQNSTTQAEVVVPLPVSMRVVPTAIEWLNVIWTDAVAFNTSITNITLNWSGGSSQNVNLAIFISAAGAVRYPGYISANASGGLLALSAEL
jgi:hypothetical protein